jgi:hypothetical protein
VWKRRPTRWLKGLDGLRDLSYALYVHEDAAAAQLGPRWGNRPPAQVGRRGPGRGPGSAEGGLTPACSAFRAERLCLAQQGRLALQRC